VFEFKLICNKAIIRLMVESYRHLVMIKIKKLKKKGMKPFDFPPKFYFNGMYKLDLVAPIPGEPCLTNLVERANSPKMWPHISGLIKNSTKSLPL